MPDVAASAVKQPTKQGRCRTAPTQLAIALASRNAHPIPPFFGVLVYICRSLLAGAVTGRPLLRPKLASVSYRVFAGPNVPYAWPLALPLWNAHSTAHVVSAATACACEAALFPSLGPRTHGTQHTAPGLQSAFSLHALPLHKVSCTHDRAEGCVGLKGLSLINGPLPRLSSMLEMLTGST